MTREEIKELLPIIQAYAEGKVIQYRHKGRIAWYDLDSGQFNCDMYSYRIKPGLRYRPFKNQEECWQEMHKHHDFGWVKFCSSICFIQNISSNEITVIDCEEICSLGFEGCFANLKFTDGTPFGLKEE